MIFVPATAICTAPNCIQAASGLRSDQLCVAHGKQADGLLNMKETKAKATTYYGPQVVRNPRLPTHPLKEKQR